MTTKLFIALYVGLIVGMFILFLANFAVAWILFGFLFVAIFGGMLLINRPALIAAGFLLAASSVLGVGLFSMRQARQVNAWPTAPGVITRAWFCTKTVNGSQVYSGPCIEYRYQVGGQTFEASSTNTGEFAQRWWTRIPDIYRQGQEVKVYYSPNNPGLSRLEAAIPVRDWITTGVGASLAALAAFTLLWILLGPQGAPQTTTAGNAPEGQTAHPFHPASAPASRMPDLADQLEKLAELHKTQALTDEEYALAKKRLLGPP